MCLQELEFAEDAVFTAEKYLRNLACGREPLGGADLPEDHVLREQEVADALELSADLLETYLANGGFNTVRPARKRPFHLSDSARSRIEISSKSIGIMSLANNIKRVLPYDMKTVGYSQICNWLQYIGALEWTVQEDGTRKRTATALGEELGIRVVKRKTADGRTYLKNVYNKAAQQFIVDNLEGIMTHAAQRSVEKAAERVEGPREEGAADEEL